VLIHLLARGHARTHRFPSLRFIDPSQLLPTRRTWIQDPLLLAVRCAIVTLAAVALAQPLFVTAKRTQAFARGMARAIVVDTSASMRRLTPSGSTARDSARRIARMLAGEAQASIVIETNEPAQALSGAVAWLASHHQRADLAIVSDFQRGQLDSSDVRAIPADVGVTTHRVTVVSVPVLETQWTAADRRIAVRATARTNSTDAEWVATRARDTNATLTLVGAENDRAAMNATRVAVATIAVPLPTDTTRAVTIVFPASANRRALEGGVQSAYTPWMVQLLGRLSARGNDVSRSGVAVVDGRRQLVLFTDSVPGSLASARVVAAAGAVASVAPSVAELEPETLSERAIESLARPVRNASRQRSSDPNGESDGRWLWMAVFVLLLIELPLRRRTARPPLAAGEERARAA